MLPPEFASLMVPFRPLFSKRIFARAVALLVGAVLAVRFRTVTAALRAIGLAESANFSSYHRVLSRARWSARAAARRLLNQLVERFAPDGPVVIGIDDTIERRWGSKIKARGIYRDPVRSSRGHFVKASGLHRDSWVAQRAALGSSPMGLSRLGAAVSDDALSFGAVSKKARPSAQEADRVGQASPSSGRALASRSEGCGRGRPQLCGD